MILKENTGTKNQFFRNKPMNKKIQKINNLKKFKGFIQLNFSKGFKYVDKAGEFFNHFYKENNFPDYIMDPNGMVVKIDGKTQLKVSPHHLWMYFSEPDTFDCQKREFIDKANLVNSIFEPEKYTRIGWRNHLVYECGDEYPNIIPDGYLDGAEFNEITFTRKILEFDSRFRISKMINQENQAKAILVDIDVFKKKDFDRNDFSEIIKEFNEIETVYKSNDLLVIINNLLG